MKKKRHVLYSVGIIAAVIIAVSAASLSSANGEGNQTLASPALSVMAEENGMAIAGLVGDSISFEKNDFARALNLKNVGDIIITKVPPVADGELRVGTTVVNEGQKISASSLSLMSYTASSRESTKTTFRFKTEDSSYDVPCTVYLLDKVNYAPTLENAPETTRQVSTHRNITYYGSLPCHDPDGDGTVI
jgi:hypothetical protein